MVTTMIAIVYIKDEMNENVVMKFSHAVMQNDTEKITQLFLTDEEKELDKHYLNSFIKYLQEHEDKLETIEKSLYEQMDSQEADPKAIVQLQLIGKKYGFFANYQLKLNNSYVEIENITDDHLDVKLGNGIYLNKHKKHNFYGPIFPGDHVIHIQFENELGTFFVQEEVTIWDKDRYVIKVDQEEILTNDAHIRETLFGLSTVYSAQIIEWINDIHNEQSFYTEMGILYDVEDLFDYILADGKTIKFSHAVFDEESFEVMNIQDDWYASARIISTFEVESDDPIHLLFNLDYVYNELLDEWELSDIIWDQTTQSIIDLWDSPYQIERKDLIDANKLELTL